MQKIIYKVLLVHIVFFSIFIFTQTAEAQYRTYNTRYQEEDSGRSRVSTSVRSEIRRLENQDKVTKLRIPILLGVSPSNLQDTWGDARSNGRTHEGIDIIVPRGSFIVSPTDAVVTTIDTGGNGGKHVFTTNPGGERYYYAHLDSFAKSLKEGQILKAGDLIGYVGNTGNASGGVTHLHFGIYDDDHDATNPFTRLTLEFSLKDKINAVTKILNASTDAPTLARSLAAQYKNTFIEAQASGITLPAVITQILTEKRTEALGIGRILQIGMTGDDVKWLQTALGVTADGSFGPKTQAAVVAFQRREGLPTDGVFGLSSRVALADSSIATTSLPSGCTSITQYSPTTGVKCIPVIVIPTPPGCTAGTLYSPTTGAKCPPFVR